MTPEEEEFLSKLNRIAAKPELPKEEQEEEEEEPEPEAGGVAAGQEATARDSEEVKDRVEQLRKASATLYNARWELGPRYRFEPYDVDLLLEAKYFHLLTNYEDEFPAGEVLQNLLLAHVEMVEEEVPGNTCHQIMPDGTRIPCGEPCVVTKRSWVYADDEWELPITCRSFVILLDQTPGTAHHERKRDRDAAREWHGRPRKSQDEMLNAAMDRALDRQIARQNELARMPRERPPLNADGYEWNHPLDG